MYFKDYETATLVEKFSDKRFLALIAGGGILSSEDKASLVHSPLMNIFDQLQGKGLDKVQRRAIDIIKKQAPAELVNFFGLKKWSSLWWSAIVRTQGAKADGDRFMLLIGWSNIKGQDAILKGISRNLKDLKEEAYMRVKDKEKAEYEIVREIENTALTGVLLSLPSAKSLGLEEPSKPLLDAFLDKEISSVAEKEFTPKKRSPKRSPLKEEATEVLGGVERVVSKDTTRQKEGESIKVPDSEDLFESTERKELQELLEERRKKALWS